MRRNARTDGMRRNGRKRRRRWRWALAIVVALLVVPLAALLFLPTILRAVVVRLASSAGADHVAVHIEEASLSSLDARNFTARFGPVVIELKRTQANYGLRSLSAGDVNAVTMDGLTVTIDCTKLDEVWLREWIGAEDGGAVESEDTDWSFAWPIERLTLQNSALVLQFPEAAHRFAIATSVERQPDGTVAFTIESDHPEQRLRLSGTIDTKQLEGDVRVDEAEVDLELYRNLATEAGLFTLPEDVVVDAARVNLSATLNFERGGLAAMTGQLLLPELHARRGRRSVELSNIVLQTNRDHGEVVEAQMTGTVAVADAEVGWSIAPAAFDISLLDDRVTANANDVSMMWPGRGSARANVSLFTVVPKNGAVPHYSGTIDLLDWNVADQGGYPATAHVEGTFEALHFSLPELHVPGHAPLALHDLAGTLSGLDAGRPDITVDASLWLLAEATTLLPNGWSIAGELWPKQVGAVTAQVMVDDDATRTSVELHSTDGERMLVAGPGFHVRPDIRGRIDTDATQVEGRVDLGLGDIGLADADSDLGFHDAKVRLSLPPLSVDAFVALLSGEPVNEDLAMTLNVATSEAEPSIVSAWELQHRAGQHVWSAQGEATVSLSAARFGAVAFTDLHVQGPVTLGPMTHEQLARAVGDQPSGLFGRQLFMDSTAALEWSASSLNLPGDTQAQWATGTLGKTTLGSPVLSARMNAGIVRSPPETLEQIAVEVHTSGTVDDLSADAHFAALLEGAAVEGNATVHFGVDWASGLAEGEGSFALAPLTLRNSDIISRWVPEFPGIAFSGTMTATGALEISPVEGFNSTLVASLREGAVSYPELKTRISSVEADVRFESLKDFRTAPGQELRFATAEVRDFVINQGYARFRFDGLKRLHVEETRLEIFDGVVSAGAFSLFFPHPDVGVVFAIQSVDAGQLVSRFDLFNGTMTGRLNGNLPVALLAGKPLIGQGYLELDHNYPATLRYNAEGVLTSDLPNQSFVDKINRLGYELAEEGLENLSIKNMHVDLFRRDLPNTPVRIELSGQAETPRAIVPMNVTTNVNGSVEEVLDFVMQFLLR